MKKKPPKKAKPAPKKKQAPKAKPAARKALRHDTPVDVQIFEPRPKPYSTTALARSSGSVSLIDRLNAGESAQPQAPMGQAALAKLSIIETLEEAYDAWLELKLEHAQMRSRYAEERARLEREGSFLLGAVKAAGTSHEEPSERALATSHPLSKLVAEAEEKLEHAREALEREIAAREKAYAGAFAKVKAEIRGRVERYAEKVKVQLKLHIRPLGASRNILHLDRISPDESILFLYSLQKAIPTRHGFLFDDSTDDVMRAPPPLYEDEGVKDTRPDATALRARVETGNDALPIKGFIPVFVPKPGGGVDFFRLLQRGAVMEVELQEGAEFRNALSREEGERFAGHLLRLKLAGRAELEIAAG